MKVTYNEMDNHLNITATANFLEELAMSEYGAYEMGCAESTDLVNAVLRRTRQIRNGVAVGNITITIKGSTAEYLMHPNGLEFHIMKWREWVSAGDFSAYAYVRSGKALQKHLEAAIKEVLRYG